MALTKADIQVLTVTAADLGLGNVTNESKTTMFASPVLTGTTSVEKVQEKLNVGSSIANNVTFDYNNGAVWHSSISANVTADFTNVPTADSKAYTFTIIVQQGNPSYVINAVTVNGTSVTIQWQGNLTPTGGTVGRRDVFTFTILRISATWIVLGSMASF